MQDFVIADVPERDERRFTCPKGHRFSMKLSKAPVGDWLEVCQQAKERGVVVTMMCLECAGKKQKHAVN